jgi:hypothetical protein
MRRRKEYDPQKDQWGFTILHGVTSRKVEFSFAAERTQNPNECVRMSLARVHPLYDDNKLGFEFNVLISESGDILRKHVRDI